MKDVVLCSIITCGVIGSFYLWSEPRRTLWQSLTSSLRVAAADPRRYRRDAPRAVAQRLVSFATSTFLAAWVVHRFQHKSIQHLLNRWIFSDGQSTMLIGKALLSTSLLWLGPVLCQPRRLVEYLRDAKSEAVERPLYALRCWLISPLLEEFLFRGVQLELLSSSRSRGMWATLCLSTVPFVVVHWHHYPNQALERFDDLVEEWGSTSRRVEELERLAWADAVRGCLQQSCVTSVFGLLSGYYYLTVCGGNVLATTAAHGLCNVLGGPPIGEDFGRAVSKARKVWNACCYALGVALSFRVRSTW